MKYCRIRLTLFPLLFMIYLGLIALTFSSEGYFIPTDVINGGGKEGSSASYKLYDSVAQPMIGDLSTSTSYTHFTGFWYVVAESIPPCPQWSVPLSVTCGEITNIRIFGVHCDGTEGYDAGLDSTAPPSPPSGFYSYLWIDVPYPYDKLVRDIRSSQAQEVTWRLMIRGNHPDSTFSVSWNPSDLPDSGSFTMADSINMRLRDSVSFCCGDMTVPIVFSRDTCDFTLSAAPDSTVVSQGDSTTYTVHLDSLYCVFSSPVALTLDGLPAEASHSFNPDSVTPPGTSVLAIYTTATTDTGTHQLIITGSGGGKTHSDTVVLTVNPKPAIRVWLPDSTCAAPGDTIVVPIWVSDVTNSEIYSFEICLTFDSSILTGYCGATTTQGTIAESWGQVTCNDEVSGEICVSMAGVTALADSGVLVYVGFIVDALAVPEDTTTIHFSEMMFNEGTPPADPHDGFFYICPWCHISGHIAYCPWSCWIDSVWVKLSGGKVDSSHTDPDSGSYLLDSLLCGLEYTLKPKKLNDTRSAISAFDASIILRCVVGLLECGPCSLIAGDVSCNGSLSAFDASLILRYVVGIINEFPCGKDWTFIPADFPLDTLNWNVAPDSIYYPSLTGNLTDQDFRGILLGDVSGNWCAKVPVAKVSHVLVKERLEISPTEEHIRLGDSLTIIVEASNLSEVYSVELIFIYDQDAFHFENLQAGKLMKGYLLESSASNGQIKVAFAGDRPISGSGSILEMIFITKEQITKDEAKITLTDATFNERCLLEFNMSSIIHFGENLGLHNYAVSQNYPNPFNPETMIKFSLPTNSHVKIEIFNLLGQKVVTLIDEFKLAGTYEVKWNGRDSDGSEVASGVYFYRFLTDEFRTSRKMLILK